jgi:hypothetical protein
MPLLLFETFNRGLCFFLLRISLSSKVKQLNGQCRDQMGKMRNV